MARPCRNAKPLFGLWLATVCVVTGALLLNVPRGLNLASGRGMFLLEGWMAVLLGLGLGWVSFHRMMRGAMQPQPRAPRAEYEEERPRGPRAPWR